MPKQSHPDFLIKLILRARALETEADGRDRGYIMLVTAVLSVMLFSLLAAYLVLTDLNKTATSAFVDSNNTFMSSEFGLNTRANLVKQTLENYSRPSGNSPKYLDTDGTWKNLPTNRKPNNREIIAAMQSCIYQPPALGVTDARGTGDFACAGNSGWNNNRNNPSNITRSRSGTALTAAENRYNHSSRWQDIQDGNGQTRQRNSDYTAYSFVVDRTGGTEPTLQILGAEEPYAGLLAQTYQYTVYASAVDNSSQVNTSNNNTVLQMDFRSRVIPLFQFAAFYDGDLEMNSTSDMTLGGRVHSNGNLYVQPTPLSGTTNTTYFRLPVTVTGEVYNRVDASTNGRYGTPLFLKRGLTAAQIASPTAADYYSGSYFRSTTTAATPLTSTEIANFERQLIDGAAGGQRLDVPPAGFLRKRNYYKSSLLTTATLANPPVTFADVAEYKKRQEAVGEYWGRADIRLEMVPDRGGINTAAGINDRIIPFNFSSIHTGNTGTCSTTPPVQNTDPDDNYIDGDRLNATNLRCRTFTKGQLQSLRQPVMVLTRQNQVTGLVADELSFNPNVGTPTSVSNAATPALTEQKHNRILRAVQVALVSTPTPLTTDDMNTAFSAMPTTSDNALGTFRANFRAQLDRLRTANTITDADRTNLRAASPNEIARLRNSWFLAAPIQMVRNINAPNPDSTGNPRRSGFYDGREQRWITMLQTNILSLSVWNRDGLFVTATNTDLTTAYSSTTTERDAAMDSALSTASVNSTNNMVFLKAAADTTPTANCTSATNNTDCANAQVRSLRKLGLGAADTTEGGLVFHATVRDDLNGNGGTIDTSDIQADTTRPILRKNPNGTNYLLNGSTVTQDYPRTYRGVAVTANANNIYGFDGKSPFGFAFNDANDLPGRMNLVTDHAAYIQGDFNNYGLTSTGTSPVGVAGTNNGTAQPSASRQGAAIMADTITILSNQCVARPGDTTAAATNTTGSESPAVDSTTINFLGVPVGQIKCGIPNNDTSGFSPNYNRQFYNVSQPVSVNAAFLAYTDRSYGNLGTGRGFTEVSADASLRRYSGGINNYMRMIEGWGNLAFNYSGSFISLGSPIESSGRYNGGCGGNGAVCWGSGAYYNIPTRNFNYDTLFNTASTLPPLTPRAVYLQQQVFRRSF
jgi:hypothetical protein